MESTEFILFRLLPPLALIISLGWAFKLLNSWHKAPVPLDRGLARGLGLGPWGMLLPWRGRFSLFQRPAVGAVVCCLGVLAARHARYFVSPAPLWSPFWAGPSLWAGTALTLLIVFFWMRRMLDERAALLSGWREHLGSGIFLLCAASGVALRWWGGLDIDAAPDRGRRHVPVRGRPLAAHRLFVLPAFCFGSGPGWPFCPNTRCPAWPGAFSIPLFAGPERGLGQIPGPRTLRATR